MSLREPLKAEKGDLPQYLLEVLKNLPVNIDRKTGAPVITKHFFPVSHRTLEAWPLPTKYVNGKAIVPTVALFEIAYAKLMAAPVVMSGRKAAA
jgi:hypothetical protein